MLCQRGTGNEGFYDAFDFDDDLPKVTIAFSLINPAISHYPFGIIH